MRKPLSTRRVLAGTAVAVAAGAALALPSTGLGGVAAIQDDVLTTAAANQVPQRLQLVANTRAKVARFDILWSFVATRQPVNPQDPADPAYNWSHVDQVLTGLDQLDVTPIVSTYSTPKFAQATRATGYVSAYNPNAPTPTAFGAFMKAVATRYSGTYPNAGGGTLPRVRHFEVWNEPNLKNFFRYGTKSNMGKYKGLVKAAYTNIKSANPNAVVIAGVGGPRSSGGNGNISAKEWMNKLVSDKSVKFDAYSQHIYPSQAPKFTSPAYEKVFPTWDSLDDIYKALDKKRKGMKLYVTEAGYTTGFDALPHGQGHAVGAEQVPEADLQPAAGQEPADGGGGLVQPAGQQELARRSAALQRRQEAVLQLVRELRAAPDPGQPALDARQLAPHRLTGAPRGAPVPAATARPGCSGGSGTGRPG